jgi:hypothetical protein
MRRKLAWTPILLGSVLVLVGLVLVQRGWAHVASASPEPSALGLVGAGMLLALVGVLMVAVPLLVPLLYRIYGDQAFTSRGTACPVVSRCPRCSEFNFRGRPSCKQCGTVLGAAQA